MASHSILGRRHEGRQVVFPFPTESNDATRPTTEAQRGQTTRPENRRLRTYPRPPW